MSNRPAFSRLEIVVVIGCVLILFALLIPTATSSREKARRVQGRWNLKHWALAVHNYADTWTCLPAGGWVLPDGTERHGWVTALLPYLDSSPLYSAIDHHLPWHHPRNQPICRWRVDAASHPEVRETHTAEGYGLVHYAVNASLMHRNSSTRFDDVPGGLSNILLLGEIAGEFRPWANPWTWRLIVGPLNSGAQSYGRPGRDETDFVLADGELKTINNDIDSRVLSQLATGGLVVRDEDIARPMIPPAYPSTRIRHRYEPPADKGVGWSPPPEWELPEN